MKVFEEFPLEMMWEESKTAISPKHIIITKQAKFFGISI
jgi:hypothetical protein